MPSALSAAGHVASMVAVRKAPPTNAEIERILQIGSRKGVVDRHMDPATCAQRTYPGEIDEVQRRITQLELADRQLAEETEEHAVDQSFQVSNPRRVTASVRT